MATTTRTVRPISRLADAAAEAAQAGPNAQVTINGVTAELPAAAVALLADLLEDLSEGRGVAVAPYELPIGTESAAEVLGVSRQWLTQMLDRGEIPMQRNGSKRRVAIGDLVSYRRTVGRRRSAELTWDFLDEPISRESTELRRTTRTRSSKPPISWDRSTGPTSGSVELPFHLYWSDDNNRFNLDKRARLRSMYQIVLTEGSDDDIRTYLNRDVLVDVWDELWLSPAVHAAWDDWVRQQRDAAA
jgi:excisionase family DNA binding protein